MSSYIDFKRTILEFVILITVVIITLVTTNITVFTDTLQDSNSDGFTIGDIKWDDSGLKGYFIGEVNGRLLLSGDDSKSEIYSVKLNETGSGIEKEVIYDFAKKNPEIDSTKNDKCYVMYHFGDTHLIFDPTISREHVVPEDSAQNYFKKNMDFIQLDKDERIQEGVFKLDIEATNEPGFTEWTIINIKKVKNTYQMFLVEWYNGTQVRRCVFESKNLIDWKYLREMMRSKDDAPNSYVSFSSRNEKKYGALYKMIEASLKKNAGISNSALDNTGVQCTQTEIKKDGTTFIFMNYYVKKRFAEKTTKGNEISVREERFARYKFDIISSTTDHRRFKLIYPVSVDEITKAIGASISLKRNFKETTYPLVKKMIMSQNQQSDLDYNYQADKAKIEDMLREILKTDISINKKYHIFNNQIDISGIENSKKYYWDGGNGSKFAFSTSGYGIISSYIGEQRTGDIGELIDFPRALQDIVQNWGYPCKLEGFFNIGVNNTTLCLIKDGKINFSNNYFDEVVPFHEGVIASMDGRIYFSSLQQGN